MQIAAITSLLLCIPAILSAPDGCPCNVHSSLRCKNDCPKLAEQKSDNIDPLKQDQKSIRENEKIQGIRGDGDLVCINFSPKNNIDKQIDGFVLHNGNFITLNKLLENANTDHGFQSFFKSPSEHHRNGVIVDIDSPNPDEMKMMRRGGWGSLSGSWG